MNVSRRSSVVFVTVLVLSTFFSYSSVNAVTLRIGSVECDGDGPAIVPVNLESNGGPAPAALTFDMTVEAGRLTVIGVEAGAAAIAADKTVDFEVFPGGVHVLIGGVNENVMADGEIALVSMEILGFPRTVYPLEGANGGAAAADATRVSIGFSAGQLTTSVEGTPATGVGTVIGLLLCGAAFFILRKRSVTVPVMVVLLSLPGGAGALIAGDVDNSGDVTVTDVNIVIGAALDRTISFPTAEPTP